MPRDWPPPSVWLLVLPLVGPPAAYTVAEWNRGRGLAVTGLVGVAAGGGVAGAVVRGKAGGLEVAEVVAVLAALAGGFEVLEGASRGQLRRAAGGLPPVGWAGCVLGLARWPETRRWCGRLPPGDPGDDDQGDPP